MRATVSNHFFSLHHRRRWLLSWFMRPKFVLSLLLLTLLVITAAALLKQHLAPVKFEAEAAAPPAVATAPAPAPAAPKPAPVAVKTVTPEERQAAIEAEEKKLN